MGLATTSLLNNSLNAELNKQSAQDPVPERDKKEKSLRILHTVDLSESTIRKGLTQAINNVIQLLSAEGTVNYEILPTEGEQSENCVAAFYQWQWRYLFSLSKLLLYLCSTVENLLLEIVMVACDQSKTFEPVEKLFNYQGFDKIDVKFADIIASYGGAELSWIKKSIWSNWSQLWLR